MITDQIAIYLVVVSALLLVASISILSVCVSLSRRLAHSQPDEWRGLIQAYQQQIAEMREEHRVRFEEQRSIYESVLSVSTSQSQIYAERMSSLLGKSIEELGGGKRYSENVPHLMPDADTMDDIWKEQNDKTGVDDRDVIHTLDVVNPDDAHELAQFGR